MKSSIEKKQSKAIRYYDRLSKVYDLVSSKWYYHKARNHAIQQLQLKEGDTVLNLPCGTGQNFEYFQKYLINTGLIIGIDLSDGMLSQAQKKIAKNNWANIKTLKGDATKITQNWIAKNVKKPVEVDAVLCDLGLSGFPEWENIIDNMLSTLKPNGIIVIMDWYIPKPTLRGEFVKWIGKGEVNRPLYQFLETKVAGFEVNTSFNRGGVFVATGIKK
jgi:ubiquinone/menaquinone biosynthesis C-methylase UbiE